MLQLNIKKYGLLSLYLYCILFFIRDDFYFSNIDIPSFAILMVLPLTVYIISLFKNFNISKKELVLFSALIISLTSVLLTGDTEFFYPIIVLVLSLRLSKNINQSDFIILTYLLLNYGYLILNFAFAIGKQDYYLLEPHAFSYYNSGNEWRINSSTLFYNSNGAGSAHSIIYLFVLLNVQRKKSKYFFKLLILFLSIISGSMSSLGFILGLELISYYQKTKHKKIIILTGTLLMFLLLNYFYRTNIVGFSVRIERIWEFLFYCISNPLVFFIPSYILYGSFYTESTLLDLFLNFGIIALLIVQIILNSKGRSYIIYLLLTSSSLTVFPAFVLGNIISKDEKISNSLR